MTTEEKIAVMEECAKLVCWACREHPDVPPIPGPAVPQVLHHPNLCTCCATTIHHEIARLRGTLEPPTAEEWERLLSDYFCMYDASGFPTVSAIDAWNAWKDRARKLLQRANRAKGAK